MSPSHRTEPDVGQRATLKGLPLAGDNSQRSGKQNSTERPEKPLTLPFIGWPSPNGSPTLVLDQDADKSCENTEPSRRIDNDCACE